MEEQSKNQTFITDTDTKFMDMGVTESVDKNEGETENLNNVAQILQPQTSEDEHSLGKFKNIDELKKAYKSLEAEFTKRSQKLSELENKKQVSWKERVDNFITKNPHAKNYISSIIEEINIDNNLADYDDCLEQAYSRALEKKIISKEQMASDQEFLDKYIYSNPEVQNKIITSYLSSIKNSHPYNLMGNGGAFTINEKNKPMSIKDCGEIVEKMFT